MDSPRRSPRISARTSLEAQQRSENTPTSSPLAARSPARQNRQPTQTHLSVPSRHPDPIPNKSRASTSNVTLNMSTRPTESPSKRIKVARRAYSVGGVATQKLRDPNNLSVPSRRNVPGPRKSAIRALPPQVFASPSEVSPRPSIRPLFSRKSLGLEAFGGSDLMGLMESIGIIKSQQRETNEEDSEKSKGKQTRKSEPAGVGADIQDDSDEVKKQQEEQADLTRKKRRVTFNPYQEKTNFEKDEPTMRIRPATELDQVLETSNSDGSASPSQSSSASTSSSDMSIDSESENEDGEPQLTGEEMDDEEDFESEAEVEGELEENERYNENMADVENASRYDESAMDMTAAYGGMQDATVTGIAHGFTDDDDSMSMQDSSSVGEVSSVLDDMTVTMQLTEMHDSHNDPTSQTHTMQEMEDEEFLDEDDIETQLSQQNNPAPADVEEEVDMELTEIEDDNKSEIESVKEESGSEMDMNMSPEQSIKTAPPVHPKAASPVLERSPLRSRKIPNARVSNLSESPKLQVRQSIANENGDVVKPIEKSPTSPQRRQSMLERRTSDSPRRGHEHCHIPAADSPKPRVSAATLRVRARREASQSPTKNPEISMRTSIGKRPSSPDKMPFRSSSSSSPRKSFKTERSQDVTEAKTSMARPSMQDIPASPSPKYQARHTSPSSTSPRKSVGMPSSPRRSTGPASPLRSPGSPSRTWQNFREGQQEPSTPKSPAKRISMAKDDSVAFTFGSPQRIALPSPAVQREAGRPLTVSNNTPARAARSLTRADSSPITKGEEQIDSEAADRWTMKRFFDMLEIGFLDLTMPSKRRIENNVEATHEAPSMVAKIRAACSTVPNLDSLISACKELKSSVEEGRSMLDETEREFYENPPSYVAEVLAIKSTSDRQKAISSFKIQKSAARAIALKAYYGWRTDKQFDDPALLEMEKMKSGLEQDLVTMKDASEAVSQFALPKLRSQAKSLEQNLTKTRKRQREIDDWDVEEMRAMHSAMQEQNAILEEQRAMHSETKEQLNRLQARLDELNQRKENAEEAISLAHASSAAIHSSTRTEANRLAKHLDQIESLHLWNVHSATMNAIEMTFNGNEISVKMNLSKAPSAGTVKEVELRLHNDGVVERMAIDAIHQQLDMRLESQTVKPTEVVRLISTAWTRVRSFSTVFAQLQAHYPSSIVSTSGQGEGKVKSPTMVIQSMILFNTLRTKILVKARCSTSDLFNLRRPLFMPEDIDCQCVYGRSGAASALNARICDALLGSAVNDDHTENASSNLCHAILTAATTMNDL
ncbi:uncharacterized protein FA14DRAFT_12438 [Meira miltonrushii]|uniref:Spc7 kinetochore protein domain-containing protein n=1 Tax=Meira miltonrushii TaxID=1280837 RepID=A0A316VP20_9BASI|nr:uncharacterized protein FA14DRAFT_12438 [Meira miltonrushii]PWN37265.1 hypothetical protein FA14DRAFT_12438 [Meira miltonrushii]